MLSKNVKEKILKIKNLDSKNYINSFLIHTKFYKDYKSKISIFNSPDKNKKIYDKILLSRLRSKNLKLFQTKTKSNSRFLSLNSDYLLFNPYVTRLMKGGANTTEYDWNKYTLSKNKKQKSNLNLNTKYYFGLPGNMPLVSNKKGNLSLSSLYSTTSLGAKTFTKFDSLSATNIMENINNNKNIEIDDNDRKTAEEFFLDLYRNKNFKIFSKENKKNFYKKYNIKNKLTIDEENKIDEIMNQNQNQKIENETFHAFKRINSEDEIQINTHSFERLYKDPYNSGKKMKIKNQIMKVIENMNINFQCEKYQKEYNTICELNMQKNLMPKVKIIPKKKLKIFKGFNADQYLKKFNNFEFSFDEQNSKKTKKGKKIQYYLFYKPQTVYARGVDLSMVELKVDYTNCIYHPELRAQTAICFNEEVGEIYLFGGLGGKKLADLWIFNFSQIKRGWYKIYETNNDSNYENDPCPRFGHSIHYFDKKLYLIGGEFNGWEKNEVEEGILCIFDFNEKKWDMMKYNYDINYYKKHKKEQKNIINEEILSYQEIDKSIKEVEKQGNKENNDNINKYQNKKNSNLGENIIKNKKRNLSNKNLQKKYEPKNLLAKNNIKDNNLNISNTIFKTMSKVSKNNFIKNDELISSNLKDTYIYPEIRKNHISLLIGKTIFLYGGETPSKKYLNDCWIYDLTKNKWSLVDYMGRYPPPLCCHSACLVLEQNQLINEALNVYYKPPSERKTLQLLKSDGVFIFGGYNENKIPTNLFFRMVIGVKPIIFEIPETRGTPPLPRAGATMNFNSENNLIVIYGGRNDIKNEVYNDIVLLDMENMSWIHTKFWGDIPKERSGHNAVIISNKLFVFGGRNNINFINFDFTIFNLDFFAQKYALKNNI